MFIKFVVVTIFGRFVEQIEGEAQQKTKAHGCNRGSTIGLTKVQER